MTDILSDRASLISRLASTLAAYTKMVGAPEIVRREVLDMAFDATASVGIFNRRHPQHRIEPISL